MQSIISWVRGTSGWEPSRYGELPRLRADDTQVHQTWLIFAGGLALILSRASRAELESRFAASRKVHAIAYGRLRKRRLPRPEPELLRNALREVSNLADPMTLEAGRECMLSLLERASGSRRGMASTSAGSLASSQVTSQANSAAAPLMAAAVAPPDAGPATEQHEATQLDLDLLFERSNKLRGAVAWARNTTFGPDQ
jgi:hypothetical protein